MLDQEALRVPVSEQLLINASAETEAKRVLCTTVGRAQCAVALAEQDPERQIVCHQLDVYQAEQTHFAVENYPNINVLCSPDLPEDEFDLFVMPVEKRGEAELTRDWLQQGYDRLKTGGWLYAAVDNPKDKWLHHEVEKLSKGLVRRPKPRGMVYKLQKPGPLKRMRDFSCEFAFRDEGNLISVVSRPGVFSHRRLDLGARALMESMTVFPGSRILDLGCGTGAVGLAALCRAEGTSAVGIDSNARAVQCSAVGAELNEVANRYESRLDCDGTSVEEESFDLVVGNPPYFSNYQIAEIFLTTARRAVKAGGKVQMVTKKADWYVARMEQLFARQPEVTEQRGYLVVSVDA
ncbi:MAG: methyltransferase [Planctomycetaceae bacterium]